jgi:hypothetical protein
VTHLEYLDTGFKIQIMLTDFINILWWTSLLDVFLFLFAFASFMASAKEAVPIFLFLLHVIRAVLGIVAVFKIPKSSKIIDEVHKIFHLQKQEPVTNAVFKTKMQEAAKELY